MVRHALLVLGVLLTIGCLAQTAPASVEVNDDIFLQVWANHASGQTEGPFFAAIYDDPRPIQGPGTLLGSHSAANLETTLLTFCVEKSNYFWSSGQYFNIDDFGDVTVSGGKTLTGYTAWVYHKFLALGVTPTTTLPTTDPNTGLPWATVMNDYQKAIWAGMVSDIVNGVGGSGSEEPLPGFTTSTQATPGAYADYYTIGIGYGQFLTDASWAEVNGSKLNNLGGYQVLIIKPSPLDYGTAYEFGQDQLFFIGECTNNQSVVPEPATMIVWALLGAASWLGMGVWHVEAASAGSPGRKRIAPLSAKSSAATASNPNQPILNDLTKPSECPLSVDGFFFLPQCLGWLIDAVCHHLR